MTKLDENQYPWMKQIKPMLRQMIREELGYTAPTEGVKEAVKQTIKEELPARHNHMWGLQERQELIREINWSPLPFLAAKHQRTVGAIIMQLKREWEAGNI